MSGQAVVPDYKRELDAYRARREEEGEAVSQAEAESEEAAEELRLWKSLDTTRKHVQRLQERYSAVSNGLIAAALHSSDPVVRGHAWRLEELHMQLKEVT